MLWVISEWSLSVLGSALWVISTGFWSKIRLWCLPIRRLAIFLTNLSLLWSAVHKSRGWSLIRRERRDDVVQEYQIMSQDQRRHCNEEALCMCVWIWPCLHCQVSGYLGHWQVTMNDCHADQVLMTSLVIWLLTLPWTDGPLPPGTTNALVLWTSATVCWLCSTNIEYRRLGPSTPPHLASGTVGPLFPLGPVWLPGLCLCVPHAKVPRWPNIWHPSCVHVYTCVYFWCTSVYKGCA